MIPVITNVPLMEHIPAQPTPDVDFFQEPRPISALFAIPEDNEFDIPAPHVYSYPSELDLVQLDIDTYNPLDNDTLQNLAATTDEVETYLDVPIFLVSLYNPFTSLHVSLGKVEKTWHQQLLQYEPKVNPQNALDIPCFRTTTSLFKFPRNIIQATYIYTPHSLQPKPLDLHPDMTLLSYLPSQLPLVTLVDTGSQKCIISKSFIEKNALQFASFQRFTLQNQFPITVGNGKQLMPEGLISLPLIINDNHIVILALILDIWEKFDLLIGHEALVQMEATIEFFAPSIRIHSQSIPLFPSKTITLHPNTTTCFSLHGNLPNTFSSGTAIIHVFPLQNNFSFNTISSEFINQQTMLKLENKSENSFTFYDDQIVAILDLRSLGYYTPPSDSIVFHNDLDGLRNFSIYTPIKPPQLPEPLLFKETMDPFPWLEKTDPRRFLTDTQILKRAIELSKSSLTNTQKLEFLDTLLEYRDAFSLREEIGKAPNFSVTLELTDTTPFFIRPFHVKEDMKAKIDKEMKRLVHLGILRKGLSGYSSPVMAIPRKNSDIPRIVTDFRHLNTRLVTVNHTFTLVRDVIQSIGASQCEVMSVIDLKDAYHTLPLDKESQKYCGITPYYGADTYLYCRLGMGLKVAPTVWQSFINSVLGDLPNRNHFVAIMDDCLVFSKKKDHLQDIKNLLSALIKNGLKISPRKCQFFRTSLTYMGLRFLIKDGKPSFTPMKDKCDSIRALLPPQTVRDCRKFCGMVNFLATFLPKLQQVLIPIYNLTRKNTPFLWSDECQKAFDHIKTLLSNPPILTMPRMTGLYRLMSDTSREAAGAALYQFQDKRFFLVGYNSKRLPPAVKHYSVTELELIGLVTNIYSFRQILTNIWFQVFVDHSAITNILGSKKKPPSTRIQRLIQYLIPFNFDIHYLPGHKMHIADILSRLAGKDLEPPDRVIPISFMPMRTRSQTGSLPSSQLKRKSISPSVTVPLKTPKLVLKRVDTPTKAVKRKSDVPLVGPIPKLSSTQRFKPKIYPAFQAPQRQIQISDPPRQTLINPKVQIPSIVPPPDIPPPDVTNFDTYRQPDKFLFKEPLPILQDAKSLDVFTRHIPKQKDIDKFLKVLESKVTHSFHLPLDARELAQAYPSSPAFGNIYKFIKTNVLPPTARAQRRVLVNAERYVIANELLFRIIHAPKVNLTKAKYNLVLVIPEQFEHTLFYAYHDSLLGAHYNALTTYHTIRQRFWVQNLFEKLQRYVDTCEKCAHQKDKKSQQKYFHPRIPLEYSPLAHLSGDIKYMPQGIHGYKYLLVLVCEITNFVLAIPLVNIDAISIAHAMLDRVVFAFGPPSTLIIDEDRALSSKVIHYIFDALNTKFKCISPYNHGSLRTERFIQTISNLVTRRLTGKGKEWPLFVSPTCWAMNTVVSNATGFSPYELVFLRKPPDITNLYFPPISEIAKGYRDYCSKLRERFEHVSLAVTELRAFQQHQQQLKTEALNKDFKPFLQGDLVYLLAPSAASLQTDTRKCRADWVGPLAVNRVLDQTHYILHDLLGQVLCGIYHINRLKPAKLRTPAGIVTTHDQLKQALDQAPPNKNPLPDVAPAALFQFLCDLNYYARRACDSCNSHHCCVCE